MFPHLNLIELLCHVWYYIASNTHASSLDTFDWHTGGIEQGQLKIWLIISKIIRKKECFLKKIKTVSFTGKNGWSVSTNMLIKFVMGDEDTNLLRYSVTTSLSCCGLPVTILLCLTEYFVCWNTPLAKIRSHASLELIVRSLFAVALKGLVP